MPLQHLFGNQLILQRGKYSDKVERLNPIAYWILGESAGVTAVDQINSPAQDGTYTNGPILGQSGIGDGNTAPLFDGTDDFVDIFSAALAAAFDGDEGSYHIWVKVANAGVWTDGTNRYWISLRNNSQNYANGRRTATNNQLEWLYEAGNVQEVVTENGVSTTDWMPVGLTWSASAGVNGEVRAYRGGVQVGITQTALGVFVGTITNTNTCIGALNSTPAAEWSGWLAHAAIWDTPLTPAQMLSLATI